MHNSAVFKKKKSFAISIFAKISHNTNFDQNEQLWTFCGLILCGHYGKSVVNLKRIDFLD